MSPLSVHDEMGMHPFQLGEAGTLLHILVPTVFLQPLPQHSLCFGWGDVDVLFRDQYSVVFILSILSVESVLTALSLRKQDSLMKASNSTDPWVQMELFRRQFDILLTQHYNSSIFGPRAYELLTNFIYTQFLLVEQNTYLLGEQLDTPIIDMLLLHQ